MYDGNLDIGKDATDDNIGEDVIDDIDKIQTIDFTPGAGSQRIVRTIFEYVSQSVCQSVCQGVRFD